MSRRPPIKKIVGKNLPASIVNQQAELRNAMLTNAQAEAQAAAQATAQAEAQAEVGGDTGGKTKMIRVLNAPYQANSVIGEGIFAVMFCEWW